MAMSYSVKVYFIENEETKEIRKFSLEEDLVGSLEYLNGKIRQVFPDLLRKEFNLYWKDEEDDYISISSDEELMQAFTANSNQSQVFKFYVKTKQGKNKKKQNNNNENAESDLHPGVTCDGCNEPLRGVRYKCTDCYDYDLCGGCIQKDLHPKDHEMLRILKPRRSGNIFVAGMPPFHFQRRRAPFRCHRRPQHFGRGFGNCPFSDTPMNEDNNENAEQNNGNAGNTCENVEPMISEFASVCGLDPEVAVSAVKVFLTNVKENFKKAEEEKKQSENEAESEEKKEKEDGESLEESIVKMSQEVFGENQNLVSQTVDNLLQNMQENQDQKNTEKADESMDFTVHEKTKNDSRVKEKQVKNAEPTVPEQNKPQTENTDQQKPTGQGFNPELFNQMANEFAKNFNINPQQINQFGNFGELISNLFQPAPTQQQQQQQQQSASSGNNKTPQASASSEFVFVGDELMTEEERYNKRLEDAIKQMKAMGFDDEGGWLKQLLIAKELNISKVLDALNPSINE